jgi:FKBP-type peptidyl-prolyl cis-trans isomerase
MKKIVLCGFMVLAVGVSGCFAKKADLTKTESKYGYAIGVNIGSSMKAQKLPIDPQALSKGILDSLTTTPQMTVDEVRNTLKEFDAIQRKRFEEERKVVGEKNQTDETTFLAENKAKSGVKVTASGLQYMILQASKKTASPKATDKVKVHYRGTLLDGTEFDSSYGRNEPVTFPVNGVIAGWTEGLQLMTVGSKFKFFIPSKLGYGDRGAGGSIGPNATLVFEVELLEINPK